MKTKWFYITVNVISITVLLILISFSLNRIANDEFVSDNSKTTLVWRNDFIKQPALCSEFLCIDRDGFIYLPEIELKLK